MILDGWGISSDPSVSAIEQANTPYIDSLYQRFAHAQLKTDGMNVGLPEGQMGNSEVGHMNLGAGRVVYQDLAKINKAVSENRLREEVVLKETLDYARKEGKKLHLLGLLSDGGVHSHIDHLKALVDAAADNGHAGTYIHAFTDGRDVDPKSGLGFVNELSDYCQGKGAKVASVIGRYFAMDRDKRWERVKKAYDLLVKGNGKQVSDLAKALQESYDSGVTDEFIEPMLSTDANSRIEAGDAVLFFNFRTDRGRELTMALSQKDFPEYGMTKLPLHYVTMTNYDDSFSGIRVIYDKEKIQNTLGEILSRNGKTQLRIAETEKYPHVTFFFNGGREEPFEGEERILCPSPKVATYDLQPEMSAFDLRDALVPVLKEERFDFVCLNFANPDMVGHTGVMEAAIKACESVDQCAEAVIETGLEHGYSTLVIADHGNCDTMINPDGSPNTAHTTNPVPIILVDPDRKKIQTGVLGDLAPTILAMMDIKQVEDMTRHSLL